MQIAGVKSPIRLNFQTIVLNNVNKFKLSKQRNSMSILVTGSAGFVLKFCKYAIEQCSEHVIVLDKFTYAAQTLDGFIKPTPEVIGLT